MNNNTGTQDGLLLEDFSISSQEEKISRIKRHPGYRELEKRIYDDGFLAGSERMRETMEAERKILIDGPLKSLETLIEEIAQLRGEFLKQNDKEIVRLACAIAGRILRVESKSNPEMLREKLQRCLMQMQRESSYLIRVNAGEIEALEYLIKDGGGQALKNLPYRLLADERVPPGGLVLEGDKTRLESICAEELDSIERHLLEQLRDDDSDVDGGQ